MSALTIIVTTPSGTFTVKFPAKWKDCRPLQRGEPFRKGDKCVTSAGRILAVDPSLYGYRCVVGEPRSSFPPGYYFRARRASSALTREPKKRI